MHLQDFLKENTLSLEKLKNDVNYKTSRVAMTKTFNENQVTEEEYYHAMFSDYNS